LFYVTARGVTRTVIPAKAGIQLLCDIEDLGPGLRPDDEVSSASGKS